MLITANQFQELGRALTAAKHDPANRCTKLRDAPDGADDNGDGTYSMWQPVSGMAQSAGRREKWRYHRDEDTGQTFKRVTIPIGEHGVAYLAINPETYDISCAACEEG